MCVGFGQSPKLLPSCQAKGEENLQGVKLLKIHL
jgi:hypothetical protein